MFIGVKKLLEVTARSIRRKATIAGPMCANVEGTGVSFVLPLVLSLSLVIDCQDLSRQAASRQSYFGNDLVVLPVTCFVRIDYKV